MQKTHWGKKRRVKTYTLGCGKLFYSIPFFGCFGESNLLINTYVFHTLDCHGNLVNFQHQYFAVLKSFLNALFKQQAGQKEINVNKQ